MGPTGGLTKATRILRGEGHALFAVLISDLCSSSKRDISKWPFWVAAIKLVHPSWIGKCKSNNV